MAASEICSSCTSNSVIRASDPTITTGMLAAITIAERNPTMRNTTATTIKMAPTTLPMKSLILRVTFSDWSETRPMARSGGRILSTKVSLWSSFLASSQTVTMLAPRFIVNPTMRAG